jgi:predicted nucleic acid-binding protein
MVLALEITGKQTHNAHLAAVMEVHSVTNILTFNTSHFGRFPGIRVLDPDRVAGSGLP